MKLECFKCNDHRDEDSGDYCAAMNWRPLSMNNIPLVDCPKYNYEEMSSVELRELYNQIVVKESKHGKLEENLANSKIAKQVFDAMIKKIVDEILVLEKNK